MKISVLKNIALIFFAIILSGCIASTPSQTTLGTLGAVTGAVINTANPWQGALIGGVLGAVGGSYMDQEYRNQAQRQYDSQSRSRGKTNCSKVRTIETDKYGRVTSNRVREVCKGNISYDSY